MTPLAPTLERFFTERLIGQRRASPNTITSYRDTFRLLLGFAHHHTGKTPSDLDLVDLNATLIAAFLDHLEQVRHNSVRTRNNRLAAIHSLFDYAAFCHPDHAETIQRVLAIPAKKTDRRLVSFLTDTETIALIAAPDQTTWTGRRDHALIVTAIHTGLRVSELTALTNTDIELHAGAHCAVTGKAEKNESPHSPTKPSASFGSGWPNAKERQTIRCSPAGEEDRSAEMQCPPASLTTSKSQPPPAPHCPPKMSHRTFYGIPVPCASSLPVSTPPSSPSGSDTKASKRPRSTSTPT